MIKASNKKIVQYRDAPQDGNSTNFMRKNKIDNLTRFIKFRNRIIETMYEKFIQSSVGTTFQF
jgi:hypothetical protein